MSLVIGTIEQINETVQGVNYVHRINFLNEDNQDTGVLDTSAGEEWTEDTTCYEFHLKGTDTTGQLIQGWKIHPPKIEVETEGTIDPAKLFMWVAKKLKEIICPNCM